MTSTNVKPRIATFDAPLNRNLFDKLIAKEDDLLKLPALTLENMIALDFERALDLARFDLIVIVDSFAVDFLLAGLEKEGIDPFMLDEVTICPLGESVSDRLRFEQLHADVIPAANSRDAVQKAISDFFELPVNEISIGIYSGEWAAEPIKMLFGDTPEFVSLYKANVAPEIAIAKTLIAGGAFDEIVFGSTGDVLSFQILSNSIFFDTAKNQFKCFAADGLSYQMARENGLSPKMLIV